MDHKITILFPTEEHKKRFAEWMSDGGGEWQYMEVLDNEALPPVNIGYHGKENKAFPRDHKRRYGKFLCDDTIRVELVEEEQP